MTTAGVRMQLIGGAMVGLAAVVAFHGYNAFSLPKEVFLGIHTMLEIFSVAVAFSIAVQCWYSYVYIRSVRKMLSGALFLAICLLDMFHCVSYYGMRSFFPDDPNVATWFWVAARLTEAIGLPAILIGAAAAGQPGRRVVFVLATLYAAVISGLIVAGFADLPPLVTDEGVTGLKIALELTVCALNLLTIWWLIRRPEYGGELFAVDLVTALALITMGEVVFTLYRSAYGLENFIGHLYKGAGYFFFLRSLLATEIREPFIREQLAAERLKSAQRHLQRFFDLSLDPLCVVGFDGLVKRVNSAFAKLMGFSEDEIVGCHFSEAVHPDDRERTIAEVNESIRSNTPVIRFENRYLTRDGVYLWLEWTGSADPQCGVIYAVGRNVTERKSLYASLRESEERFRGAFENAGTGMALIGLDGKWLQVNWAMCEMLGYSKEELEATTFQALTHPDDLLADLEQVRLLMKGEKRSYRLEKRYFHKQGYTVWAILSASLVRNSAAAPLYLIVQVQNITAFRTIRDELVRVMSVINSTEDAIIGKNADGVITSWNRAAERMFQYSGKEITGSCMDVLVHPDYRRQYREKVLAAMSGEKVDHFETVFIAKDGTEVAISSTVSPVRDSEGKTTGVSSIARDIRRRRELEAGMARLERLNMVAEMAAGISHEVRNPLTSIRGFLQMLGKKPEIGIYREFFELMIGELDRANSIISEFLSLGRQNQPERRLQSLNDIIRDLEPLLGADAQAQDKEIVIELGDVPELNLCGKEMRQMILNLARNGFEAMEKHGRLSISTFVRDGKVVLAVGDQGRGIPPEILPKLGTPFFTTKANGTGLGLGVCYSIASRNGATIGVESSPRGTVFNVEFEVAQNAAPQ